MARWRKLMIAAVLGLTSTNMVAAQGYPARPVTMIVPFPAGGGRAVRSADDGYTFSVGTWTTHMLTGGLYALRSR